MQNPAVSVKALRSGGIGDAAAIPGAHQGHAADMRTKGLLTRRVAQVLVALVALGATGAMIWARYPRGVDELWSQAESADQKGQYLDAARAFERLAEEYPTHPRTPEALYRLGYVEKSYLNNPEAALAAYGRLVRGPGDNKWKRRALAEIGGIYRSQQDYDQAISAYESLESQYSSDAPTRAQARLQLAQTYFQMEDAAQARASCEKVRDMQDADPPDRVRALRLLSRVAEKLEGDPRAAMDPLVQIIGDFPNTADAEEALRDLAFLRSRESTSAASPAAAAAASAKVGPAAPSSQALWVELPQSIPGGVRDQGLLECLRVLCAQQGAVVSEEKLAGLSGQAFSFWYSSSERLRGDRVYLQDPAETAAKRVGLTGAKLLTARDETSALTLLKQQIHRKHAVLIPMTLAGKPTWRIVTGYDPAQSEFLLYSASGRYEAVGAAEFRSAWTSPSAPAVRTKGAPPAKYSMYVVQEGRKPSSGVDGAKAALREAVPVLRGTSTGGYVSGAKAFRQLSSDFARLADGKLDEPDAGEVTAWCGRPLSELRARRESARKYVEVWRDALFPDGAQREKADRVTALLGDSVELLSRLGDAYARAGAGSGPSEGGGSPSDLANKLAEIDEEIAAALDALV